MSKSIWNVRAAGGILVVALVTGGTAAGCAKPAAPPVNVTPTAWQEFQDRVKAYMGLRQQAESKVPNLAETNDPKKIADRERALGQAIAAARSGAVQGAVFTPPVAREIRAITRRELSRRTRRQVAGVMEEVPTAAPQVNAIYPTTGALATVPPLLLARLPELPEPLEYRLMGRTLILRDTKANLIVDFVPDAIRAR